VTTRDRAPGWLSRQTIEDFPVGTRVMVCAWGWRVRRWHCGSHGTVVKQNRVTVVVDMSREGETEHLVYARPSQVRAV
jgi:hypothetical protein